MERIRRKIGDFFREWWVFPAAPQSPGVVFLTGTGGTATWANRETGWSQVASEQGFTLIIPEALPPDPHAPPAFLANPPRWNDGSPPLIPASVLPDDVQFLDTVLDDAIERLQVDPRRVYLTGFSNGAGMTFRYAAERAERVSAIAPVAGYCWLEKPQPARPVPTLYTVGTADLLLPLRGGEVRLPWTHRLVRRPPLSETLERWALAIGCSPIPRLLRDEKTVRIERYPGPVVFDVVMIEGLGHHWPGGRAQLNPRMAGPPSQAVNATEMIAEFFQQQPASAPRDAATHPRILPPE
jgi:polyhydroxybutyrate depolymerase